MPNIHDVIQKKRFKKKAYRPWNLLDEPSSDISCNTPVSDSNTQQQNSSKSEKWQPEESQSPMFSNDTPQLIALDIASISPANNQHIASISPAIPPANNQHIASIKINREKQKIDITSISPAIPPADTPAYRQQPTSISPAIWNIAALSGKEALLLNLIFQYCKNAGSLSTENIGSEQLAEYLNVSTKRLNNLVERLLDKRLIEVIKFKPGRGSWRKFRLNDTTYREATICDNASISPATNQHIASISPSISPAISPAKPSSSSSSLDLDLNKLTNTRDPEIAADLPAEWKGVDTSSLVAIRFGQHQLVQIHRLGMLTVEQVQESISSFAFDLEVNGKSKEINGHALNYFMGILRKGPYAPSANYEAPEIRQMRLYLEAKEREQKIREELEFRLQTLDFNDWISTLTSEEISRMVPPSNFAKIGSQGHNVQLKQYFRENVWPERWVKIKEGKKHDSDQV